MSGKGNDNPFSDHAIRESLENLPTPDKGGVVTVEADKKGVEAEVAVAINEHWSVSGWFKRQWNGAMDYAGKTQWKW